MIIYMCTHTANRSDNCTYLDARLTFRSAESTGLVEICNEQGQWSVVCADNGVPPTTANVICNQLSFDRNFVNPSQVPLLNVGRPLTFTLASNLLCNGNESTLTSCFSEPIQLPSSSPGRQKRRIAPEELPSICGFQAQIQCGGEYTHVHSSYHSTPPLSLFSNLC